QAKGGNADRMKAVQQALKDKGHDPGPIDGRMGPKTQAALKDFQKAEGIKESGRLDSDTMAKLGVQGMSGSAGTSSPSASPATDKATSGGSASPSPSAPSSSGTGSPSSSTPSASSPSTGGATDTKTDTKTGTDKK